ncbi:MAG TPA: aspartate/glutamate racemase family protein [Streptosporangiaceae bacterium]|nr:aspartate/glutamate racemase family protein [Streptosporangiaceae bacterium]
MTDGCIARGGPASGADVGVILLDTDLPRPPGDVGNARSFDFPVHYEVAPGASPERVVELSASGLLEHFVDAGRRLAGRGARALTTCCGFLAIYQRELAARLDVPVATSSLLQVPLVLRMLADDARVGLITINGASLGPAHFAGAGITEAELSRVTVIGLEHTEHFYPVIIGGKGDLDVRRAEAEVVAAAAGAVKRKPSIAAFVLECTNLPPYSRAIRAATGRPVWDALTLINWLEQGARS